MTGAAPPPGGLDAASPAEFLEALGHAVIVTDLDGVIEYVNGSAERLYGCSSDDAVGRQITEVTVPQVTQDVAADIMAALRAGVSRSGSFPVRRQDGTPFHALVTDTVLFHAGRPVGIVGVSADLGSALRTMLERSSDAVLLLNRDGESTYVSPAVEPLFGWQSGEVLGTEFARLVHPEDRELFTTAAAATGERRVVDVRVQGIDGWVLTEAAMTNRIDDPHVRAVVCNLHYSDRLVQLNERQRISERVHVEILQDLFTAVLDLEAAIPDVDSEQEKRLIHAREAVTSAISALRAVVRTDGDAPRRDDGG